MAKVKEQNQLHPPQKKNKTTDDKGNVRKRVYAKSGGATLPLATGLTANAARCFIESIKQSTKNLGGQVACEFIVTQ